MALTKNKQRSRSLAEPRNPTSGRYLLCYFLEEGEAKPHHALSIAHDPASQMLFSPDQIFRDTSLCQSRDETLEEAKLPRHRDKESRRVGACPLLLQLGFAMSRTPQHVGLTLLVIELDNLMLKGQHTVTHPPSWPGDRSIFKSSDLNRI